MKMIGAGWVGATEYGAVCRHRKQSCESGLFPALKSGGILNGRVKNAGKFDAATRRTFAAAALALHDAAFEGNGETTALIGAGSAECTQANQTFFRDYTVHGRQLARANLFIYTLPTSPLAEIAIHFNLGGPLFYTQSPAAPAAHLLAAAGRLLAANAAEQVLLVWSESDAAAALILAKEDGGLPPAASAATHPLELIRFLKETP